MLLFLVRVNLEYISKTFAGCKSIDPPTFMYSYPLLFILFLTIDTETITEYRFVEGMNDNKINAICRIAVYLTPNPNSKEGILWQEVNGKAVGFYDYELNMERIIEDTGENIGKSCIMAPDRSVQCYS